MLRYLVRLSRSGRPVAARRSALVLVIVLLAGTVVPIVVVSVAPPLRGSGGSISYGFVLSAVYFGIVILFLLQVPLFAWSRLRRQRRLSAEFGSDVQSVYLSPELLTYLQKTTAAPLNPYADSVSVVASDSAIVFWVGGGRPSRVGSLARSTIRSIRLVDSEEGFLRPEIHTESSVIPLYPATGWLGMSRAASRHLYESLHEHLQMAD
jgi:hypothetical protein